MAYCATTRPNLVNTLLTNCTGTGQIYITGVGGWPIGGCLEINKKWLAMLFHQMGQQLILCRHTFGPHRETLQG